VSRAQQIGRRRPGRCAGSRSATAEAGPASRKPVIRFRDWASLALALRHFGSRV